LPVYKRYIGPSGSGSGANAVHDCRRRAFDQRVFVTAAVTRVAYFVVLHGWPGRWDELMQAADRLTIDFWTSCDNQLACQSSAVTSA